MMNGIQMIDINLLKHHPENPRKDLGDLTELAESIKKNGIMQNLTVVPSDTEKDEWLVVIGNRRMEAAKMAGLEELPCVVSFMNHREQIATMLEENMQRADLTVYEQAQGFQMMMDLGYTAAEISEKTGFSRTTVDRRLKMAELDKETFRKAVGKQITMDDLDRLGQIRDVKKRNELLKEYGDNSYEWKVTAEIRKQKANEVRPKAMEMVREAKAEKIPRDERYSGKYEQLYALTVDLHEWNGKKNIIPKTEDKLYYDTDDLHIYFYTKKKRAKGEPVIQKTEEEKEEDRRRDLAWKTVERVTEMSHEMRVKYAEKMKVSPTNAMQMLQWMIIAAISAASNYNTPKDTLKKRFGIESYNIDEIISEMYRNIKELPQSQWAGLILQFFEGDTGNGHTALQGYADGYKREFPKYKTNKNLDLCYMWLTEFGYEMCTEEIEMMAGTHPVFQEKMAEA